MQRIAYLEKNLRTVQRRIADAATRAKRDPNDIMLVAVSKTFPPEAIIAAYDLGIRNFGENRMEEAAEKIPSAKELLANRPTTEPLDITWHLIGHLQSRKVKSAVRLFDCIHSVDSVELAERIDRICAGHGKTIPILLEVNISGETSKYGFQPEPHDAFFNSATTILKLGNVDVKGLMTIAPIVSNPSDARPFFRALRVLRDELQSRFPDHAFPHLSMGMTDDFEAAIDEGATMVRIGRAIFGERI